MNFLINKEEIKKQVTILRGFLMTGGYELSQSAAYNLMANLYGFESWNQLSAILKQEDHLLNIEKIK